MAVEVVAAAEGSVEEGTVVVRAVASAVVAMEAAVERVEMKVAEERAEMTVAVWEAD